MSRRARLLLGAFFVIVVAVGSTIEVPDPYPTNPKVGIGSQVVDDTAIPGLVRYEDGSWSDGYCEAGALCDDTHQEEAS